MKIECAFEAHYGQPVFGVSNETHGCSALATGAARLVRVAGQGGYVPAVEVRDSEGRVQQILILGPGLNVYLTEEG